MPSFQGVTFERKTSPRQSRPSEAAHSRHAETEEDEIGYGTGKLARDHDNRSAARFKRHYSFKRSRPLPPTALADGRKRRRLAISSPGKCPNGLSTIAITRTRLSMVRETIALWFGLWRSMSCVSRRHFRTSAAVSTKLQSHSLCQLQMSLSAARLRSIDSFVNG